MAFCATASFRAIVGDVPVMFVQAENDFDTSPSRILSEAMRAAGKPFGMKIFPPYGQRPKRGTANSAVHGASVWGRDVIEFLRRR